MVGVSTIITDTTTWAALSARERDTLLTLADVGGHEFGPSTERLCRQLPTATGEPAGIEGVHTTLAGLAERGLVERERGARAALDRWWMAETGSLLLESHATTLAESLGMHLAMDGGRR